MFINWYLFLPFKMSKINVKIFIDSENLNKTIELESNLRVEDLLKKLNINPVTVIVSRNNELILEDEKLKNNDGIRILSVISGG